MTDQERIEALEELCRISGVPELLIEYPTLINGLHKATPEEIEWAEEAIKRYEESIKLPEIKAGERRGPFGEIIDDPNIEPIEP